MSTPHLVDIYRCGDAEYETADQKYGRWQLHLNVYKYKYVTEVGKTFDIILVSASDGLSIGFGIRL